MTLVVLSLGSNINREKNIGYAVREIRGRYGVLEVSPVYETSAVGFDGPPFYNLVVGFESRESLPGIIRAIREMESGAGRVRGPKTFDSRVLDIDVILYGNENWRDRGINVPRDEIERYAYVLKPLVDLYPGMIHPVLRIPFREMWDRFEPRGQTLFLAQYPLEEGVGGQPRQA